MSEEQFKRVEKALEGLEKTKIWFRNTTYAFIGASVILIGSIARNEVRISRTENDLSKAASIKSIELLNKSFTNTSDALLNLVDEDYRNVAIQFIKETQKLNDNIFMYSTQITRGGTANSK